MSRAPEPLPPSLGGAFAVGTARELGIGRGRLRARDLETPFWGMRAVPFVEPVDDGLGGRAAQELRRRIDAYATRMAPGRFFVGLSALVLWLDLLPVPSPRLDVGAFTPARAPRAQGVRGHECAPHLVHVVEHEGRRLSSPASTWATLARDLPVRDLVAVASLMITAPHDARGRTLAPSLTSRAALEAAVAAGPRHGIDRLRAALPYVREGARSRPEVHLYVAVVDAGLGRPDYDVPLYDADGLIGWGDLVFQAERVLVEYQGDYHRLSRAAWAADIRKRERAMVAGWRAVQLTREHLYPTTAPAVARIAAALRGRS